MHVPKTSEDTRSVCVCSICSSTDGNKHTASEKMLGLGGSFHYWECANCGCLALMDYPSDWSVYYPRDYYSYAKPKLNILTQALDRFRTTNTPLLSPLVNRYRPDPAISALSPICKGQTVLDVGAGSGRVVIRLRDLGIKAVGIDPFLATDIFDGEKLRVKKAHLQDINESFDLIYLNHSFEHMPDQIGTLRLIRARLNSTGRAVIRIPIPAEAWRIYGTDWYQLDAPRHLFLHTEKSLAIIAEKTGMKITRCVYDSDEKQFHYSSLYKEGLTITQRSEVKLSKAEAVILRKKAHALNGEKSGDMACFTLSVA